jgi:hypothetical protein
MVWNPYIISEKHYESQSQANYSRMIAITEKRRSTTAAVAMKTPDIMLMSRKATTCTPLLRGRSRRDSCAECEVKIKPLGIP